MKKLNFILFVAALLGLFTGRLCYAASTDTVIASNVEIWLLDCRMQPIAGVHVEAHIADDYEARAAAVTDQKGCASFKNKLLPGTAYCFVASFDNNFDGLKNLGDLPEYDDHEYGYKALNSYFITNMLTVPQNGILKRAFTIDPSRYVDFADVAKRTVDFWLAQAQSRIILHFTAFPGCDVVRIYMPMNYIYTAQPLYADKYSAEQPFMAIPKLLMILK